MDEVRELETGFTVVPGSVEDVSRWVAAGPVAAYVVAAPPRWSLVAPVTDAGQPDPFDHPAALVAGRRLPSALTPTFGIFVVGERAVVTLQTGGFSGRIRWTCWSPTRGAESLPRLAELRPEHLARAATSALPDARERLEAAFAQRAGTAERFLRRVVDALALPGEQLIADPGSVRSLPGAELVNPTEQALQRFARTTRSRVELREEKA